MGAVILSDAEKKELIKKTLDANHHATGRHFPAFSKMMDGMGHVNDALSFAELLPALNMYLTGATATVVVSGASLAGVLLFPIQQIINLINANETGQRMYSYRAISYTITAWAFNKPIPSQSPRNLSNLRSGHGPVASHNQLAEYHKVWWATSSSVVDQLNKTCLEKNIQKPHLKAVFRAFGEGRPDKLSLLILKGFEQEFGHTTTQIWRSTYSIVYPS